MAGKVVRGLVIGAALLTFAACGGDSKRAVPRTTTTTAPKITGFAECPFAAGGPVSRAGVATGGPNLAVSWDTPSTISDSDSLALVTTVGPYRISFKRDGVKLTRTLFDSTTGAASELLGPYTETEQGISILISLKAVPGIKPHARWHSSVQIDGTQVARCPATGSAKFGDTKPKE